MLLSSTYAPKAVTTSTPTATTSSSSTTTTAGAKSLGQNDFLKLIGVQLTQQDPTKPMDDTAFIAQMAQFTSLDQTKQLVTQTGQLRSSNNFSLARSLIGQSVTVTDTSGTDPVDVTGTVSGVDSSGSEAQVLINGKAYSLSQITKVEPPASTTTTKSATTATN